MTAGVLRGERARFQIFGATVNTASRMESTGTKGCIQVSQVTAKLLDDAGKQSWTEPRKELVEAKGIGSVQTYWVQAQRAHSARNGTSRYSDLASSVDG